MIRSPSSTYSLFNILEILLLEGRTSCSITNIKKNEALLVWYLVLVPTVLRNSLLYTLDQGLLQYFCFCHLLFNLL
jgi:hypothetical protein